MVKLEKKKKVKFAHDWVELNKNKPFGMRSSDDVTDEEEYASFRRSLSNDWEDLCLSSNSASRTSSCSVRCCTYSSRRV